MSFIRACCDRTAAIQPHNRVARRLASQTIKGREVSAAAWRRGRRGVARAISTPGMNPSRCLCTAERKPGIRKDQTSTKLRGTAGMRKRKKEGREWSEGAVILLGQERL